MRVSNQRNICGTQKSARETGVAQKRRSHGAGAEKGDGATNVTPGRRALRRTSAGRAPALSATSDPQGCNGAMRSIMAMLPRDVVASSAAAHSTTPNEAPERVKRCQPRVEPMMMVVDKSLEQHKSDA